MRIPVSKATKRAIARSVHRSEKEEREALKVRQTCIDCGHVEPCDEKCPNAAITETETNATD